MVIIDGDTIERVCLLNIDVAESFRPRCGRELVAGLKAKERLAGLLRAGSVEMDPHEEDRCRRTLARVYAGGRVGEILVREGLALPWKDGPELTITGCTRASDRKVGSTFRI